MNQTLPILLSIAGAAQLAIAALNLNLVRLLHWKEHLQRLPLLLREVFYVHSWFISVTLTIFGVFTLRFASEMNSNVACRWIAAGIGIFWAFRAALQVFYYSSSHWRGKTAETVAHVTLLVVYGGMAITYIIAAFAPLLGG